MLKYALIIAIEFFDALFKVHYTKGFRLTYPLPLPTSVAGILASMLGIQRSEVKKRFQGFAFGSAVSKDSVKEAVEQATFIQFSKNRLGVAKTHILLDPAYYLVAACSSREKLQEMVQRIQMGLEFLPFGGQNDYFVKDWSILGIEEVNTSKEIGNYLPSDWVASLKENVTLQVLPVNHKITKTQQFHFILSGAILSKEEQQVCQVNNKNIAIYALDDFYTLGQW